MNNLGPPTTYEFSMDRWSPSTIPARRLAQYMEKLALLFGEQAATHFVKIRSGSAKPIFNVEQHAAQAVWDRLNSANDPSCLELAGIRKDLNKMLMEDDQIGYLKAVPGQKIIHFPGRQTPIAEELTVHEHGTIEGIVIRVGGRDATVPVHIDAGDGLFHKCTTTRTIAKRLAPHLFEGEIRLSGKGKWQRNSDGEWKLAGFDITDFEPLEPDSPGKFLKDMRAIEGSDWNVVIDPHAELKTIRGD